MMRSLLMSVILAGCAEVVTACVPVPPNVVPDGVADCVGACAHVNGDLSCGVVDCEGLCRQLESDGVRVAACLAAASGCDEAFGC